MARKRRAPSPPPPPPPPQEESSAEDSSSDDDEAEEEPPRLTAPQNAPQKPQPPPAAAADSSEEGSDSDADAEAFQLRQVSRPPTRAPHLVPQPESDADEEGQSSDSEFEKLEPVIQKKKKAAAAAAAAGKSKAEKDRKRPTSDPDLSGKAKKAKAGAEKAPPAAAVEVTPTGKGKKAKAETEKAAPEPTPSGKGKKAVAKWENMTALDPSPSSKSEKPSRVVRVWTKEDETKILEALAAHVKSEGTLPKTDTLLTTVRHRLERKNCNYTDIYEKVRRLKERFEKAASTGNLPTKEDELRMYNLSEAVWGENSKEAIAAATSHKDGALTKSKKGQASIEKMDVNSKSGVPKEDTTSTINENGNTQKGRKKGQTIKDKTDRDAKSRLSKDVTATATSTKSKKHGNHSEELDENANDGILKVTATATQNGGALTKRKREKGDKGKMDRDMVSLMPKEATATDQSGGTLTKSDDEEIHDVEIERDANVEGMHRGFDELQKSYSNLASYVERIEAQHPCGETLKRAFELIGDEKAQALEYKIKKHRVAEAKAHIRGADIKKEVLNMLIGLVD